MEIASKQISLDRLNDLLKEYDAVFPGLQLLVQSFVGCAAVDRYESVTQVLDNAIAKNSFTDSRASDFAILESGSQAFDALYGVGFFGFEELGSGNFSFSHDGAYSARPATKPDQKIAIHPCYWKALDTKESPIPDQVLMEIHDEYETHQNPELQDSRVRMLGQLVTKLPQMELGDKGSTEFEDWVHRTIRILFAGNLANPKLHPNGQAIQRRDIVATNMANDGFWKRVFDDYQSRQVIFEVKNYIDLKLEDIRQGLSYTGGPYGRFVIIVSRSGAEVLDSSERGWVQEMYQQHQCLVFLLPAMFLARCLRKIRKAERYDYTLMLRSFLKALLRIDN